MNLCCKLGLGTVQWGMQYGIANRFGRPEASEVAQILLSASRAGISLLDTAHVYGDAESVIGQNADKSHEWQIVTKTLPIQSKVFGDVEATAIYEAFDKSLRRLRRPSVYGLMVHSAENLLLPGADRLWGVLQEIKSKGLASKIGVSVYTPDELSRILDAYSVDLVQLPLNLYDQRFLRTGLLDRLKLSGIEVHARSAFLQGLLLMPMEQLPEKFNEIRDHHMHFQRQCDASGISPLEASLRFCLNQSTIDRVIVGCETLSQFTENLEAARNTEACLSAPELFALEDDFAIDPRRWSS
ncbi:MAG: aldo/keto reductase [Burkholderiales bacterium]|nr:aldo/keto reductase [Burkholderiales bacterium]